MQVVRSIPFEPTTSDMGPAHQPTPSPSLPAPAAPLLEPTHTEKKDIRTSNAAQDTKHKHLTIHNPAACPTTAFELSSNITGTAVHAFLPAATIPAFVRNSDKDKISFVNHDAPSAELFSAIVDKFADPTPAAKKRPKGMNQWAHQLDLQIERVFGLPPSN